MAASATPSSGGGASGGGHLNPTPQSTPAASAPSTSLEKLEERFQKLRMRGQGMDGKPNEDK